MLLPVWVIAMLLPWLKLTVSPAVICSVVALLLLANVQPFCNSVMFVMFWFTMLLVAYSWEPLIASVLRASTRPAATFWICRSLPALPTLTTPTATWPAVPVMLVALAAVVVEAKPKATLLLTVAVALTPKAILPIAPTAVWALLPMAMESLAAATVGFLPVLLLPEPKAIEPTPLALA